MPEKYFYCTETDKDFVKTVNRLKCVAEHCVDQVSQFRYADIVVSGAVTMLVSTVGDW